MKLSTLKQPEKDDLASKITPINLIDVFVLLLIFFMLATTFKTNTGVNVQLPKSNVKELSENREIIISLTQGKKIYLNNKIMDKEFFEKELSKELSYQKKNNVIIRADKRLDYGFVITVMGMAKSAGATELDLATDSEVKDGE